MATSTTRKQRFFHTDDIFSPQNYKRFFGAMLGYIDTFIDEEYFALTATFIMKDDYGRPYASYRFHPDLIKGAKAIEFDDEIEFLERYPIYLDDTSHRKHKSFSIYRTYQAFMTGVLSIDTPIQAKESSPLQPTPMSSLFPEDTERPDPAKTDFSIPPLNRKIPKNFLLAENVMVYQVVEGRLSMSSSEYMPLPIFAFGELVGMIYYIYDKDKIKNKELWSDLVVTDLLNQRPMLMRIATREYENIVRDFSQNFYGPRPKNPLEDYKYIFSDLNLFPYNDQDRQEEPIEKGIITQNKFLKVLGYEKYYNRLAATLREEDDSAMKASINRIKSAIAAIIVDSFAHNIGAHSLVALKWWFENRFKIMDNKFPYRNNNIERILPRVIKNTILQNAAKSNEFHQKMSESESAYDDQQVSLLDIIRFMPAHLEKEILGFLDDKGVVVGRLPVPVDHALTHFFQYLRDKSAFWSGAARDQVFSGRIKSWQDLLREFLANTLFLGSVAHSEQVNRLNVFIEIIDPQTHQILIGGEYACVDLTIIQRERFEDYKEETNPKSSRKQAGSIYSSYAFLREGKKFHELQQAIEKLDNVYLPNGIIGQQALYTILENTLRNIKHYSNKRVREDMRKNGLNLVLSIESCQLQYFVEGEAKAQKTNEYSLFKLTTWLHHPQYLIHRNGTKLNWIDKGEKIIKKFKKIGCVLSDHTQQLQRRIVNKFGSPILGGSSQDKVCAAMLMNNRFLSVELTDRDEAKRHYYPYVFPATEISHNINDRYKPGFVIQRESFHKILNEDLQEISRKDRRDKYVEILDSYLKDHDRQRGLIQKSWILWKGEKCKFLDGNFDLSKENVSRFRIVIVDIDTYEVRKKHDDYIEIKNIENTEIEKLREEAVINLRKAGVIRIVFADKKLKSLQAQIQKSTVAEEKKQKLQQEMFEHAMMLWLEDWLCQNHIEDKKLGFQIRQYGKKGKKFGAIGFLERREQELSFNYFNTKEANDPDIDDFILGSEMEKLKTLTVQHGNKIEAGNKGQREHCKVRNHCSLVLDLYKVESVDDLLKVKFKDLDYDSPLKLLETLYTRITIFDDRMYERIPQRAAKQFDPFRKMLRIVAFPESEKEFRAMQSGFDRVGGHFLIMHLSFLESITKQVKGKKGERYKENEVKEFFEAEIETFVNKTFAEHGYPNPDNYLLVITSGRGRADWIEAIDHPRITFRPIEDLVNAIEDGLSLKDDFQVKFNLCNVLLGS